MKNVFKNVSVVIPVLNEGKTLLDEIGLLKQLPYIKEIIIVDDGSRKEFADSYKKIDGIKLLVNKTNLGKTPSVKRGAEATTGDYIFFMDGDLINLTLNHFLNLEKHIDNYDLIRIVLGGDALLYKLIGSPYMYSGEHILTRKFFNTHKDFLFDTTKWGLESRINDTLIKNECKFGLICLKNANHLMKSKKYNSLKGFREDMKMTAELLKEKNSVPNILKLRVRIEKEIKKMITIND